MDAAAKQQIVERVKQATNVLVTVSANPSVDQLAACIGLTLLLNKMEKHATAVFSGKVPSTIEFLQPEKTIETNTDSLQDFIISLDKNKADKLRYKVEDEVVRIFITPYRSSLSEKDLVFSQGDFNVDVVIALGIKERSQIDQAIAAHGRILHDATVISVNSGAGAAPQLGQINWQDPAASSLCEMLVSISEAFGTGLIDSQTATAFLTGIVAETIRFSNNRTSPKVMTMAAQLMAAGANQQLIASKLEPPVPDPTPPPAPSKPKAPEAPKPAEPKTPLAPLAKKVDTLKVQHKKDDKDQPSEVEFIPNEIHIDDQGNLVTAEGESFAATHNQPEPEIELKPAAPLPTPPAPTPTPVPKPETPSSPTADTTPSHAFLGPDDKPTASGPTFAADMQNDEWIDPYNTTSMDILGGGTNSSGLAQHPQAVVQPPSNTDPGATPATSAPTSADPGVDDARNAVQSALASAPFDPGFAAPVDSLNAQPVGPDLHSPEAASPTADETPSLNLPANINGTLSTTTPPPTPTDIPAPPAPPPVPPPLQLPANPGATLPNP